jgi:hypothetical protein
VTEYWFKPKRYGYGATPATWQGWAVIGAGMAIIVAACLLILSDPADVGVAGWITFMAVVTLAAVSLWIVSARKTDGAWRWRWGNEQD